MAELKLEVAGSRLERDTYSLDLSVTAGDKAEMGSMWL